MSAPERNQRGVAVVWAEPGPAGPHLSAALRHEGLEVREACCAAEAVAGAAVARGARTVLVLVEPGTLRERDRALQVIRTRFPSVEVWECATVLRALPMNRDQTPSTNEPCKEDAAGAKRDRTRFSDVSPHADDPARLLTEAELAMLLDDEPGRGGRM